METLELIDSYCESLGLELIRVDKVFAANIHFGIMCRNEEKEEEIKAFLKLAVANGTVHIIFHPNFFDLDSELQVFGEDEGENGSLQLFEKYRKYDNEVFQLELYWTKEGASYAFLYVEDWYQELRDTIDEKQVIDVELAAALHPKLPKNLENEIVEQIAGSDEYFRIHKWPRNLPRVFKRVLGDRYQEISGYDYSDQYLRKRIATVFQEKYQEPKEEEFHNRINELELTGLNKKDILKELGISDSMYEQLK